jgi:hypothetical protein
MGQSPWPYDVTGSPELKVEESHRLGLRTAFEALRAGVPNRAAVLLLGSGEDAIEERFEAGLGSVWGSAATEIVPHGPARHGLMFAGGFGTGKSHLLGFLREAALRRNFVVSSVTVSKETPLSAPLAVYTAALRNTVLPGDHADDVMTVALAALQRRPEVAQELEHLVGTPQPEGRGAFAPVFAALLHLLGRPLPVELLRGMESFLAGGKPPTAKLRQALIQAGARGRFDLGRVSEATLALQRERFAPLLFRAAGFAGWCVLIDEVELIGRYSPLQRARAYAELARWLGLDAGLRVPGLQVAAAITDDFAAQVIIGRQDGEKLPERLRLKGLPAQASLALAAMRAIEAAALLHPPAEADLLRHLEKLRQGYSLAYGWQAPGLEVAERRTNRTMRHHIRGWITQWDIQRLQGRDTRLELGTVETNYAENEDFTELLPPPDEET